MAIAGRHHRVCVATLRRPHSRLLESGLARSPCLADQPLVSTPVPILTVDSGLVFPFMCGWNTMLTNSTELFGTEQ